MFIIVFSLKARRLRSEIKELGKVRFKKIWSVWWDDENVFNWDN